MEKLAVSTIAILWIALFAPKSHAFLDEAVNVKLHAPEPGTVEDLSKKTSQPIANDADLDLQLTSPVLVTLKGRLPMLLIPVAAGTSQVTLNPPLIRDVLAKPKQAEVSNDVTEIMMGISTIQKDIQKRDVDNASFRLEELRKKYPDVEFLEFVRGSILLLQGQKAQARRAVSRALESHPNYKEGQEFLKALGGADGDGAKNATDPAKGDGQ